MPEHGETITELIPVVQHGPAKGLQLAAMYYVRADGYHTNMDDAVLASGQNVCGPCLPAYLAYLEKQAHESGYIDYTKGYRLAVEAYVSVSDDTAHCAECGQDVRLDGADRKEGTFFWALGQAKPHFHETRRVFCIIPAEQSDGDFPTVFSIDHNALFGDLTYNWQGAYGTNNSFQRICDFWVSLKLADRRWFAWEGNR